MRLKCSKVLQRSRKYRPGSRQKIVRRQMMKTIQGFRIVPCWAHFRKCA